MGKDTPLALLIEDDASFRESLAALVRRGGFDTAEAGTLVEAREELARRPPDLVLLDLELPDGDGLDLRLSEEIPPDTPFVVVTGDGSAEAARSALREGATDYLTKPIDPTRLEAVLNAQRASRPLREEVSDLRTALREAGRFGALVGRSTAIQKVYDLITRVAPTSAPILLSGESGTGKELVAGTVHEMSARRGAPYIAINCGAIPATLIESRLFGHEKGAFTGADSRHQGVFEQADGGTLLLDEIGEMPMDLQVRLLRVLEEGSFRRIGGSKDLDVDVRIVAATNRDPRKAVEAGQLREDLYHRLNVFPIHLPPLRERSGDVGLLAEHFLQRLNEENASNKRFAHETLVKIERAPWTGNVRELRNAIHRAWILADEVIPPDAIVAQDEALVPDTPQGPATAAQPRPEEMSPAGAKGEAAEIAGATVTIAVGASLAEAERRLIQATLEGCDGNKRKTARVLGISVKTLYNRLASYEKEAEAPS